MASRLWSKLLDSAWLSMGYASFNKLPEGISFAGGRYPAVVKFLKDITWTDENGHRHTEQEIFDEILSTIRQARKLIILDLFLFNDFQGRVREETRAISSELTETLVQHKTHFPDTTIILITDPVNTIYGSETSENFTQLADNNILVVTTDLDKLRDSNPIYSFFWRLLIRPFHNSHRGWLPSPFENHKLTVRSYLRILNFKANHRKTILADDGESGWTGIITTGNPHDGSSAHRNVAIKFNGPAVRDLYTTEKAALEISNAQPPTIRVQPAPVSSATEVQIVSEKQIKVAVLEEIELASQGDSLDLILFYFGDQEIIRALKQSANRGARVRIILDPNKDAFGLKKIGIPNRPVAYDLQQKNIRIRWAHTHGEQCHSKMLLSKRSRENLLVVGSANFTRRNLDDFNLETDVIVSGPEDAQVFLDSHALFERLWKNEPNRFYTVDYDYYHDDGKLRYWLYRLMELTGISTF